MASLGMLAAAIVVNVQADVCARDRVSPETNGKLHSNAQHRLSKLVVEIWTSPSIPTTATRARSVHPGKNAVRPHLARNEEEDEHGAHRPAEYLDRKGGCEPRSFGR